MKSKPNYNSTQIDNLSDKELDEIFNDKPVVLVGSVISLFPPTNLPSGEEVNNKIYDRLIKPIADTFTRKREQKWIKEDFDKIPFEALMECYPNRNELYNIIVSIYGSQTANSLHRCLTKALISKKVSGIITTNYDLAFESCFGRSSGVMRISCKKDYQKWKRKFNSKQEGLYFKIHGTAEADLKKTLVFNLESEGLLEKWKKEVLEKMLENKKLIILCYSGRDFELCPEIARYGGIKKVYWLHLDAKNVTPNSKRVLQERSGTLLVGDIKKFLKVNVEKPSGVFDLEKFFDESYMNEWQLRILDRMGFASLGLEMLKDFPNSPKYMAIRANMFGHAGQYKHAANVSLKLSNHIRVKKHEKVRYLINASEYFDFYGDKKKAQVLLQKVEKNDLIKKKELRNTVEYKKVYGRFLRRKFTRLMDDIRSGKRDDELKIEAKKSI